jgi:flagellar hook-associated protein 2
LNVKASYDASQDKFSFLNSEGGEKNGIQLKFANDTAGQRAAAFFNNLGLVQSQNGQLVTKNAATGEYENTTATDGVISFTADGNAKSLMGTNGSIVVDGVSYDTTDNKITVGNITYDVTGATAGATSTVAVSQDVDAIVDKVKSFVADYNKLLSSLYEKYDEKPNSDYKPLTQSQKDSMKDEQIEKWETKAKAGLLYHDRTIGKIINEMRNAIVTQVEGLDDNYNSAFSIGLSTTGIKGQLTLDEDKLRRALADNPDAAYNVFAAMDTSSTTAMKNSSTNGIAQRLGDIFTDATKSIKQRAGSSADITEDSDLNNLLRQLQTRMSNFKKMMSSFEDALYKKYDAMEATLARLGTQLNYVMGGQQ